MKLLYKIIEVIDKHTGLPNIQGMHREGRVVHVGDLSLGNSARFFYEDGVTITSRVESWAMNHDEGKLEIETRNSLYTLYKTDKC